MGLYSKVVFPLRTVNERPKMSLIELLVVIAAFLIAGAIGGYFHHYIGSWAWIPAVAVGALLTFIAGASLRRAFLDATKGKQRKA